MTMLAIDIEVPFATFRRPHAWSYYETFPVPPPSTIYGFLLSYLGLGLRETGSESPPEPNAGVRLALARLGEEPEKCTIIRKQAQRKYKPGTAVRGASPAPEEVLCGLSLRVWVDSTQEEDATATLESALAAALEDPARIAWRVGGLSLGESRDLVNSVKRAAGPGGPGSVIMPSTQGSLVLPVWAGHRRAGGGHPRWQNFVSVEFPDVPLLAEHEWFCEPLRPNAAPEPVPTKKAGARSRKPKPKGGGS